MKPAILTYASLILAISLEVAGTTFLKQTAQFTKLVPSLLTALCYGGAFYALSFTLQTMPVGIAYAIWGGLGIVLVSVISYFVYGQQLDIPAMCGITLIISGVLVINLLSKSVSH